VGQRLLAIVMRTLVNSITVVIISEGGAKQRRVVNCSENSFSFL
jgi:hypothetical protein